MTEAIARTISLSLVSHTNAGKTTLARTLLGQDVGEIRDESHVTDAAESFEMVVTEQGDKLQLWDTPGFGDSARLAKRLTNSENPLGWMVGQVWDRFADRAMYSSQQAIRNVREHADVVLYLVNAAEDPEDAGYVEPEMQILAWTGKPVIVLLNQMGPPQPNLAEQNQIKRWQEHLSGHEMVHKVLALDAFARCWVQESALLDDIAGVLPTEQNDAYLRLRTQWFSDRRTLFDNAIALLANGISKAATDIERVPDAGLKSTVREVGATLGLGSSDTKQARDAAMVGLAERWDAANQQTTNDLIELHGLSGEAVQQVITRVDAHYAVQRRVSESKAAVVGGVATGALAGLKADVLSGGLTLGGGMIAGGVLGALGAAGLAKGYNMVRGINDIAIQWSEPILLSKVTTALLTYLAVAHFGRGRGNWERSEYPPHWLDVVQKTVDENEERFTKAWKHRDKPGALQKITPALSDALNQTARDVLVALYPESADTLKRR
jgi:hypothetical protein